jgi:hypothetical protein
MAQPQPNNPALKEANIMSIFSGIEKAAKSTVAWIDKEFTKILKISPTVLSVIDTDLSYTSVLIEVIVERVAGTAAEEETVKVLAEVRADIKVLQAVLYDTGTSTTVSKLLDSIIANLTALETAEHISNTAVVTLISKVLAELDVIAKKIESLTTTTSTTATATTAVTAAA